MSKRKPVEYPITPAEQAYREDAIAWGVTTKARQGCKEAERGRAVW